MESDAAVESLLRRLDLKVAVRRGELDALLEKVTAVESDLGQLSVARDVLLSLDAAPAYGMGSPTVEVEPEHSPSGESAGVDGSVEEEPPPPVGLEEGRERILVLLAGAGRAMRVRDIAAAIGEDISLATRVETTRSRLKKLVKEGRLIEERTAWFAIAPASGSSEGDTRVR
ncbi:hypothetical protein H7827_18435 [Streptomyces sp. JH002]|uniref:hypothetical protein n=1 Tax=Streptomyces sp. JH002 TaxID=2763259 RepID=UPI003D803AF8